MAPCAYAPLGGAGPRSGQRTLWRSLTNLLGDSVTWEARVRKILELNCGGCHVGDDPQGGLNLVGDGVYERLLGASEQIEGMNLIEPADPESSYLYLKLIGDDRIDGKVMPYNPLTGEGMLDEAELADVLTWITNGAVERRVDNGDHRVRCATRVSAADIDAEIRREHRILVGQRMGGLASWRRRDRPHPVRALAGRCAPDAAVIALVRLTICSA